MQFRFNTRTTRCALSASMLAVLAACGGGGGGSSGASAGNDSITLSGQVVDSAISGARVCLFSNGAQALNAAGAAICSSQTDTQGNYTLTIPKNLASGFLTLVATKGTDIKLASTLGTSEQVLAAAGNGGAVTPSILPTARVTHFTTADFVLADSNNDGTVTKDELASYVSDFAAVQKAATAIKAVIDFGQTSLIGGQTTNTLTLAAAAGRNQTLGSTGKTGDQWFADPANANVVAAVNQDVKDLAKDLNGKFVRYQFTQTITASTIPPVVKTTFNGIEASIYCGPDDDGTQPVDIAFDATRRLIAFQFTGDDGQPYRMVGSYNPQTGGISLSEVIPKEVNHSSNGVTYYTDGHFKMSGTVDASGNITGTMSGMDATTWSIDPTRQECPYSGTVTAKKL